MKISKDIKAITRKFNSVYELLDEFISREDFPGIGYRFTWNAALVPELVKGTFTSRELLVAALKPYLFRLETTFNNFKMISIEDFENGVLLDSLHLEEDNDFDNISIEPFELNKLIE